jgi:CDP-4-dehydro-6-deoxyglucose reductase
MATICDVTSVEQLNNNVYGVRLVPRDFFTFYAGQYIELLLPDHDNPYAFSIANAPHQAHIELHIRHNTKEAISGRIIETLQKHCVVTISEAKGECILKENPNKPLIFLAASTCFAQIKSLVEFAFNEHFTQPLYFYWGVRIAADFYLPTLHQEWIAKHSNFHFIPVVGEADANWQGRQGLVHKAVMHDFNTLDDIRVYACGSPKMIYAVLDDFVLHGLDELSFFSDVLDYAPRLK